MSIERKIGQMLMVGVPGTVINHTMKKMIRDYHAGGFIFFGYNCDNKEQITGLAGSLQDYSVTQGGLPLFISIDQEGGRVVRITDGVTQFPGSMAFGSANDEQIVRNAARITGIQLRLLGINMNLMPDIDVNNNPDNPVINTRAFGSRPEHVARLGSAYIRGIQASRCMAVAKHFPGHGDTHVDSHVSLPQIDFTRERLDAVELVPFRAAVTANCSAVMSAHIRYPRIDPSPYPATLSRRFLTGILREEMEYDGLVMTDDLEMGAIASNMGIGEAAVRAVKAGADIILVTTHFNTHKICTALTDAVKKGEISQERINASVGRILRAKREYGIYDPAVSASVLPYRLDMQDARLLSSAADVNRQASEKALYFRRGSNEVPFRHHGSSIVVPASRAFAEELAREGMPFARRMSFWKGISPSAEKTYVYYECRDSDASRIVSVANRLPKNYTLIAVSTGNPFTVAKHAGGLPVLFTFSNTRRSYNAVISALRGKTEVQESVLIDLGFPDEG
ncbi:MAG: beta-N-acetylhexosaminidase [Spirochaetota bacterium]